jgi:hypothetical protein
MTSHYLCSVSTVLTVLFMSTQPHAYADNDRRIRRINPSWWCREEIQVNFLDYLPYCPLQTVPPPSPHFHLHITVIAFSSCRLFVTSFHSNSFSFILFALFSCIHETAPRETREMHRLRRSHILKCYYV